MLPAFVCRPFPDLSGRRGGKWHSACHQDDSGLCQTAQLSRFLALTSLPACLGCPLLACPGDGGPAAQGENVLLFPAVKTEAASGGCPLQGLLHCLKEIPAAPGTPPSPPGAGGPRLPEDVGAWKRTSGGKGQRRGRMAPDIVHSFRRSKQAEGDPPQCNTQATRPCVAQRGQESGIVTINGAGHTGGDPSSVRDHFPDWLLKWEPGIPGGGGCRGRAMGDGEQKTEVQPVDIQGVNSDVGDLIRVGRGRVSTAGSSPVRSGFSGEG